MQKINFRTAEQLGKLKFTTAERTAVGTAVDAAVNEIGTSLGIKDLERMRGWYCKAAYKYGVAKLYDWAGQAKEARNPAGYFNWLVKNG